MKRINIFLVLIVISLASYGQKKYGWVPVEPTVTQIWKVDHIYGDSVTKTGKHIHLDYPGYGKFIKVHYVPDPAHYVQGDEIPRQITWIQTGDMYDLKMKRINQHHATAIQYKQPGTPLAKPQ
jgi:hypothetical protein